MRFAEKTARVNAKISVSEDRALRQMAKDNERSIAGEIRLAIQERLKKDGRLRR